MAAERAGGARWLVLLALLLECLAEVQAYVTVHHRGSLSVKRGRTGYLHPKEIGIIPSHGEKCIVEVLNNDPMTQRVGKFKPEVFDCDFQPYAVKYEHNGSPLLNEDRVKLFIHMFSHNTTRRWIQELSITITNARYEIFVQDSQLRPLEVEGFFGTSNVVDTSVLRFSYNYYDRAICTVSFNKWDTHYPMFGEIMPAHGDDPMESLTHDCRDFLYLGLRYQHLRPPTPETDYLPLAVEVSDPTRGEEPITEHMYLPIRIKGAYSNTPPKGSYLYSYIMEVEEFVIATIDPDVISAKDAETPEELLVFNITKQPRAGEGFFVLLEDPTLPIFSFKQSDLIQRNIGYHPPEEHQDSSWPDIMVEVEFIVFDSQFMQSDPISLNIRIVGQTTEAPRIAKNRGLTLIEGQTLPITSENLKVIDSDNPDDVRMYVKGGLRHGRLEVDGENSVMFSLNDLETGKVVYRHDESDTTEDKILLRVSDHAHTVRTMFPIHILPKDDSAPYLVNNVGLEVTAGSYVQITEEQLSAHDKDSDDEHILYMIKTPPEAGEIVRKYRPMIPGHTATIFSQLELKEGLIYYHHTDPNHETDSFDFRLVDNNEPPNKSGKYGVTVVINPVEDRPPMLVSGSSRQLIVAESEVALITKPILRYTDLESYDEDITYTVIIQPFFLTTTITIDAGRIVALHNQSVAEKDASIPTIHTFKQIDINEGRIAYMPPYEDIGPIRRHARFMYTVSDPYGNKVMDQPFDIIILPVNNKLPHISVRRLSVMEGGLTMISANDISAYDPDTDQNELLFILDTVPQYGNLMKEDVVMQPGEYFTLADLTRSVVKYVHDGSDVMNDHFALSVSDGVNHVSSAVHIDVRLINDHSPQPLKNLQNHIQVLEGGETPITSVNLAATDNDTDDQQLTFITISSPQYGEIQVRGRRASRFTQADIWNRNVRYVHISGEIGTDMVYDSATFAVTDQELSGITNAPLLDLNITILPVDDQPPFVILGSPMFVIEGQRSRITLEVLSARDVDTPRSNLRFYITKQPDAGYLENSEPVIFEKNQGRPITEFTVHDIMEGYISYVQSEHSGTEPLTDAFEIYVTDGKVNSLPSVVQLTIIPSNDEIPTLDLDDFQVEEGGEVRITRDSIRVSDGDLPNQELMLSVAQHPMYGELLLKIEAIDQEAMVEVDMHDVHLPDLDEDVQLIYRHNSDGSESLEDKFTLQVSDGKHVAKSTSVVAIKALNDGQVFGSNSARLQVQYGGSAFITGRALHTANMVSTEDQVFFNLITSPQHGLLQFKDVESSREVEELGLQYWVDIRQSSNFTQQDVNNGYIRYLHLGGVGETGTDLFVFQVTDGQNKLPIETCEIEIIESKSHEIQMLVKSITVKEGDSRVISTDVLSAVDPNNKPTELVFRITRPPAQGHIGIVTEKNLPISSFTQFDVEAEKIVYTHTSKADITEDSFHFMVYNSQNHTRSGIFNIDIEPFDKELPTLVTNVPLTVVQGDRALLMPSNLLITDPDTHKSNLTFIITEPPQHGHLLSSGMRVTEFFTQHEVDQGDVSYQSDRTDESGVDFFLFRVSDSHHNGYLINNTLEERPTFFSILIQPLSKEPPRLITNKSPQMLESLGNGNYGFILNNKHLQATHPLSEDSKIVYRMLVKPANGYIENLESGRIIKKRFRQHDLDAARLAYVLDGSTFAHNDSFTFRVQDTNRNTLDHQRFDMEWSVVEFEESDYVVCEDAGTLTVKLTRTGALEQSCYLKIKIRGRSAKENEDFEVPDIDEIHFEPGQTVASIDIDIRQDDVHEKEEKFRLKLKSPVNAILGSKDHTDIQIINLRNGRCSEYIGMISKNHQPTPMPDIPTRRPMPTRKYHQEPLRSFEILDEGDIFDLGRLMFEEEAGYDDEEYDGEEDYDALDEAAMDEEADEDAEADHFAPFGLRERTGLIGEGDEEQRIDLFALGDLELEREMMEEEEQYEERQNEKKKKKKKRKEERRKQKKSGRKSRKREREDYSVTDMPPTTTLEQTTSERAPQRCNKDTQGLLYYDFVAATMFRCNGFQWVRWQGMQAGPEVPPTEARVHDPVQALGLIGAPVTPAPTLTPSPTYDLPWEVEVERAVERERLRENIWHEGQPAREPAKRKKVELKSAEKDNEWPRGRTAARENSAEAPLDDAVDSIDECPSGWTRHRDDCYQAFLEPYTWDAAERRCRDFGGHLSHVESVKHLDWLRKLVESRRFWIGLNDKRLHHVWEYTTGGPVRLYHWRKGFPRNQPSLGKNCVLVSDMEWVNRPCNSIQAPFTCSKPHQLVVPPPRAMGLTSSSSSLANYHSRRRRWRRRRDRPQLDVDW